MANVLKFFVKKKLINFFINSFGIIKSQYENKKWTIFSKNFGSLGKHPKIWAPYSVINPQYIFIGDNFHSKNNLRLEAIDHYNNVFFNPSIVIGDNVSIETDCHIGCINKIIIEQNVLIAGKVFITDHSHGDTNLSTLKIPPKLRNLISKGPVHIKENVWIGEGVCVMPNVTIGENSIIGANSVVTKDVPPNSVFAGIPAKKIK